ncbi:hypothetical protein F5B22DRAFT_531573 [Xylaria bambusicola]|uniref:uncharacterized protein n=1 Tax=Xylaria bambusicola TaxID=326684 RepID=UPI002008380A|nr:uncharacterized protein F5B22DRAFT_531573 [Xylaria bambusicola]KAI0505264.1 hypothetical protein F5B22DRAFT_531573 [Xylaria bambusicola]
MEACSEGLESLKLRSPPKPTTALDSRLMNCCHVKNSPITRESVQRSSSSSKAAARPDVTPTCLLLHLVNTTYSTTTTTTTTLYTYLHMCTYRLYISSIFFYHIYLHIIIVDSPHAFTRTSSSNFSAQSPTIYLPTYLFSRLQLDSTNDKSQRKTERERQQSEKKQDRRSKWIANAPSLNLPTYTTLLTTHHPLLVGLFLPAHTIIALKRVHVAHPPATAIPEPISAPPLVATIRLG